MVCHELIVCLTFFKKCLRVCPDGYIATQVASYYLLYVNTGLNLFVHKKVVHVYKLIQKETLLTQIPIILDVFFYSVNTLQCSNFFAKRFDSCFLLILKLSENQIVKTVVDNFILKHKA